MITATTHTFTETVDRKSDKELMLLWQSGDASAFEMLYHRYALELLKIAMQKTNDREAAKELVQQVFISFFSQKENADQISSPMAWLYTALKNKILDQYRHTVVRKKFWRSVHFDETIAGNNVHDYIDTKELEKKLSREISRLPAQCAHVFRLRREQNLSNKEIAHQLNISENTVEQHMRKALRILKHALQAGQGAMVVSSILHLLKK